MYHVAIIQNLPWRHRFSISKKFDLTCCEMGKLMEAENGFHVLDNRIQTIFKRINSCLFERNS